MVKDKKEPPCIRNAFTTVFINVNFKRALMINIFQPIFPSKKTKVEIDWIIFLQVISEEEVKSELKFFDPKFNIRITPTSN